MKMDEVSRRFVVGALGVGAAAAATRVAAAATGAEHLLGSGASPSPARAPALAAAPSDQPAAVDVAERLIAPLRAGSTLARWTVEKVLPIDGGAASVVLVDADGSRFQLDVCARDPATSGPGRTEHFEVLLANAGDGATATFEDHGLAAMALAEVIRGNEQHVERSGFRSLSERIAANTVRTYLP